MIKEERARLRKAVCEEMRRWGDSSGRYDEEQLDPQAPLDCGMMDRARKVLADV